MRDKKCPGGHRGGQKTSDSGAVFCLNHITQSADLQPWDFMSLADVHDLAAADHWRAAQHHALQALKHAQARDAALMGMFASEAQGGRCEN